MLEEIKEDLNKHNDIPCSQIENFNIKVAVLQVNLQIWQIIQISAAIFFGLTEINKLILKFI